MLALLLAAVVPVILVSLLTNRATTEAFHDYANARASADAESLAVQVGQVTGQPVVVVGDGQTVLAQSGTVSDSDVPVGSYAMSTIGEAGPSSGQIGSISSGPTTEGVMSTGRSDTGPGVANDTGSAPPEEAGFTVSLPGLAGTAFFATVKRALLIAAGSAALCALLLAWLLSRQIIHPVEALTAAAQSMASGELDRRVHVTTRDELGTLATAFNVMADSRAHLEELRRNLVNDVAHELRTPLANLQGYLELLRDGLTPPTPDVTGVQTSLPI